MSDVFKNEIALIASPTIAGVFGMTRANGNPGNFWASVDKEMPAIILTTIGGVVGAMVTGNSLKFWGLMHRNTIEEDWKITGNSTLESPWAWAILLRELLIS